MAEIKGDYLSPVSVMRHSKEVKKSWVGLVNGDTGEPLEALHLSDKSVHITGTFDTTTLVIQGSNDGGTSWVTLTDPQGNALSFTSTAKIEQVMENTQLIRPEVTAGGGNTDVNVFLVAKGEMI